jgi:hypothetical protein
MMHLGLVMLALVVADDHTHVFATMSDGGSGSNASFLQSTEMQATSTTNTTTTPTKTTTTTSKPTSAQCSPEIAQKAAHFYPVFDPPLLERPALQFRSAIQWDEFGQAPGSLSSGGVYAAWYFQMGVASSHEDPGYTTPSGYMGAQVHSITGNDAGFIFSVWDGDRTLGSGHETQFKASSSLVWPLSNNEVQRDEFEFSPQCQRNCQDCSLEHLQELKKQGFTTGTQCKLNFPEMGVAATSTGGLYELRMKRIAEKMTINTSDYQGMPAAHEAVNETDRNVTGSAWQVVVLQKGSGQEVEVGRLLFENSEGMGITRLHMFDELLGCNKCDDVYHRDTRFGPFIEDPDDVIRNPVSMTWSLNKQDDDPDTPEKPCLRVHVYGSSGNHSVTLEHGPPVPNVDSTPTNVLAWDTRNNCEVIKLALASDQNLCEDGKIIGRTVQPAMMALGALGCDEPSCPFAAGGNDGSDLCGGSECWKCLPKKPIEGFLWNACNVTEGSGDNSVSAGLMHV